MNKRILFIAVMFLTSCGLIKNQEAEEDIQQTQAFDSTDSTASLEMMKVDVNKYPANKVVCDPFVSASGTQQTNYEKGLKAELFYRAAAMPIFKNSFDYITKAKASTQTLFLSDVNVPTRMFTEGFITPSGNVLHTDNEEKLIEYFGLKMTSNLVLADGDEEGDYELALLSDDGSTLSLRGSLSGDESSASKMVINNDGDHPTKMGCATDIVSFHKGVLTPIQLTYYQGPRYHISNVLIWRKASIAGRDSACGQQGNEHFFDPNQGSKPLKAFNDLLARGWKVVKPDNFVISETKTDYNPCVVGTDPVISNFELGEVILQSVALSWSTDIPATSQVIMTNIATGGITVTTTDNLLRTNHSVILNGLQPNTTYRVQAYSISADLGKAKSLELEFKTQ